MTIQDFMLEAERAVTSYLEERGTEDLRTELTETVKANDCIVHGLNVRTGGELMGRAVYLDDLFCRYEEGEELQGLLDEAARRCEESLMTEGPPLAKALDLGFESIRDRLAVRLLGVRNNVSYMSDRPYIDAGCGLALVAVISIDQSATSEWAISVTHDLLRNEIGCDRETLLTAALENTVKIEPPLLVSLADHVYANFCGMAAVKNYLDGDEIEAGKRSDAFMLTNRDGFHGAAALFYPGMMERLAELFGCGYYVLPSSVHELIILPEIAAPDVSGLKETVREANTTVIGRDELLSWNVFRYDPCEGRLKIARDERKDFVVIEKRKCDNVDDHIQDAAR